MSRSAKLLFEGIVAAGSMLLVCGAALSPLSGKDPTPASPTAKITIDYPLEGSIFPPEITPPTFLWHDPNEAAKRWVVEVSFAHQPEKIRQETPGDFMKPGESDSRAGDAAELSPELATARTWKPDEETWAKIKRLSVKSPATITISGFADGDQKEPVSASKVTITTSEDPVGAPIFYRDVPLMLSPADQKGPIAPLPPSAIPLIKWQLRYIDQPQSRTMMENLPTCANCHSFSTDGKTLGLDMDGPRNDKGLYAIVPISKEVTIRNRDMIRWSSFKEHPDAVSEAPTVKRFGFMSQLSPDGRYVVSSIGPPDLKRENANEAMAPDFAPGVTNRLFSINYRHIEFIQVFYPTRGILAYYDRVEKKMRTLPGADDPQYVQTSAFWSPDGKYLIYSRAIARDPLVAGAPAPTYANDPNETPMQYDLYKIPFNDGKGGKAVPVEGASQNGMSNDFPKVSPDGRWIVFVQNKNGLLMRPDSKLYIVPFEGGKPRLMNCNTSRMNSWHTFSPNGRWLAFSSKARSPFTQLMLTHIDANGNDSPAILIDNTTAANRAVNIPEFLNIGPGGMEKIDPQATEFYRLFTQGYEFIEKNQLPEAIETFRAAIERDPDDPLAHYGLATALSGNNQENLALPEYRKACELNTTNASWFDHLAVSLELNGLDDEAIVNWKKAIALDPHDASAETDMGMVMFTNGRIEEGLEHLRKAVEVGPEFPVGHNHLGLALAKTGKTPEAVEQFQKAVALMPKSAEFNFNLGYLLESSGDFAGAVAPLQKSVELSEGKDWRSLAELGKAYHKLGRSDEAIQSIRQARDLAVEDHDDARAKDLQEILDHYQGESAKAPPR
ncbi:MAG: tetratricopeptide repeat protein [Terracidiphilus sp.]|jgi:Flp pilus assembly protein TadD